jgi:aspartate kinase
MPGTAAKVFHTIAAHDIVVDDIIQTVHDGTATVSFTVELDELPDAKKVMDKLCTEMACDVLYEDHLAKVSVVGVGMRVHTGVAERMFEALAAGDVNIDNITTSEIKISCLVNRDQGKTALRLVHDAFDLGAKPGGKKASKRTTNTKKAAKKKAGKKAKKS